MSGWKRVAAGMFTGLILLSLAVCSQRSDNGGYYLDPAKYVGTWTLESGTMLEKLILTEDTWIYIKGDEVFDTFCYYQGGTGTFEITATTIDLQVNEIFACPDSNSCAWYAKGSGEYTDRVVSEQESVPYAITDTTLTLDLGSGPQEFTKQ